MEGTNKDLSKVDLIAEWFKAPLSILFTPRAYAPVTTGVDLAASNAKRELKHTRSHKYEMVGSAQTGYWQTPASGLSVKTTITRKDTGETASMDLKNTDDFIPDGRGPHGVSIDYSSSFRGGRTAHFDLVRDNVRGSATFDNVSGSGWVKDSSGAEIAKVYFNVDGTGYYTLASESYATQHPFVQTKLMLKRG